MKPDEMKELAQLIQKVPGLKGIDFKEVKRLADLLRETPEIGSLELKGLFGTGVVITRAGIQLPGLPVPAPMAHAPAPAPPSVESPRPAPAGSGLKEIKSPMVGTFYSAPEPGADPYVKVGARISSGQT